jgi:hypothetical protein
VSDELLDRDQLETLFDNFVEHLTDVIASAERHNEVKSILFRCVVQLQLLQALYEVDEPDGLDELRRRLTNNDY